MEESLLQQNVCGKWSTHNEYDKCDKHRIENDDAEMVEENGRIYQQPIVSETQEYRKGPNTGVKSVMADYDQAIQLASVQQQERHAQKMAVINKIVYGSKVEGEVIDLQADDSNSDIESDDDSFFEEFKRNRLIAAQQSLSNTYSFGCCYSVNTNTFLAEVCECDPSIYVIVHIYNQNVSSCQLLNSYLDQIAKEKMEWKFVKFHIPELLLAGNSSNIRGSNDSSNSHEFISSFLNLDNELLPIIVIYKNSQVIHTLISIEHDFNHISYLKEDIITLLESAISNELH